MIRTFLSFAFLFFGLISLVACNNSSETQEQSHSHSEEDTIVSDTITGIISPTLNHDTIAFYDFKQTPVEVIIKYPTTDFKGAIIALPGWNYPNSDWCDETTLCEKALQKGYALVLPEMGKSIYCDTVFPETRKDWLKYPTRQWINETMIPNLQSEFQLLIQEHKNFVMGLSTGARGAVLLAIDQPELFAACGALSGDFDQTRYTKDKLYNGYYGSFDQFTDRWLNNDNAITSINELIIPVYIGHGGQDKIVPIAYSQQLYDALQKIGNHRSELHINKQAGHTYEYWDSEVDALLNFFDD